MWKNLLHGQFELASTGTLTIDGDSFIVDASSSRVWQKLWRTFNFSDGLFEITNNSIRIHTSFVDNITGGIIRTGGTLSTVYSNTFKPSGGTLEFTSDNYGSYIDCSNGNYVYNVVRNSSNTFLLQSDLIIKNDLTIDAGVLNPNSHNIAIGGNWTNSGGIHIYDNDSYTLTEDITGGTIRTVGNFTGTRTDFNPTGGTIELYGSTDANLSMGVGSNFYDILINKTTADKITKESKDEKIISYNRDGTVIELTRNNGVNAISAPNINRDLIIKTDVSN